MFITENFMLNNKTAQYLFFDYAKDMPIFDYHCHLDPKEMYENKEYDNISKMWLSGDHYKWRLMRNNGVDEYYITGNATDYEKFEKFIECLQYSIGNPMYHWCHLELKRYFDVDEICKLENIRIIWDKCNEKKYTPLKLIEVSNVSVICTTDDPTDSLEYHKKLSDYSTKILPTFRPDKVLKKGFEKYIKQLGQINSFSDLINALEDKIKYFKSVGCCISDHGLDIIPFSVGNVDTIFKKVLDGYEINDDEFECYQTAVLIELGKLYKKYGFTMQLHMNVIRNNNTQMFKALGTDSGYDSIRDLPIAYKLSRLLDSIGDLPKTILYSLNPADNYILASMTGNFRNVQFGSGWWFNDNIDGMREQLKAVANVGALNKFVGMLTDSRSFLSYPRHEYFRRVLCNLIGEWVEQGLFPNDKELLKTIIQGICYNNAVSFFR